MISLAFLPDSIHIQDENEKEQQIPFCQYRQMNEQILKTQDAILKDFQLPSKKDYVALLWFKEFPTDFELEERIIALHQSA
jgi:hypothetical protein